VRFWDSSALVPLFVEEEQSEHLLSYYEQDQTVIVWWAASVEVASAIARQERQGSLSNAAAAAAMRRLAEIGQTWQELQPTPRLRQHAQRLLRVHALRAADALQLAAALTAARGDPSILELVCLDQRLTEAAHREGFLVLQ